MIVLAGLPSWALAGGLACADAPRGANASNVTPRRTPVSKGRRCHRRKRLAAMGPVPDKASARPTTATMAERSLTVTHAVGAKITDCQNRAEQCATQKRPLPRRYPARVFKRGEAVLRATRALGLRKHRTTPPVFLGHSRRTGIEQGGRLQHLAPNGVKIRAVRAFWPRRTSCRWGVFDRGKRTLAYEGPERCECRLRLRRRQELKDCTLWLVRLRPQSSPMRFDDRAADR